MPQKFAICFLVFGLANAFETSFLPIALSQTSSEKQSSKAELSIKPWRRHTIDNTARGADGVRLADANGDGLPDICTGWEEGGEVRVYLNPGKLHSKKLWPRVTVGKVASPEDAVFCDLDNDGALDVVSCCEGKNRTVYVHWAPKSPEEYLKSEKWITKAIPVSQKMTAWMFCVPMQIDNEAGIDLVVGSKNPNGRIGWLQSPKRNPRELGRWKFHLLQEANWIMSLKSVDGNWDGFRDILVSDRKGKSRGVYFLINSTGGKRIEQPKWKKQGIGAFGDEVMFLDFFKNEKSNKKFIATITRNNRTYVWSQPGDETKWTKAVFPSALDIKQGKAIKIGDIDLDGKLDLVQTFNTSFGKNKDSKPGVVWLKFQDGLANLDKSVQFKTFPIVDMKPKKPGKKFDRIELLDLDQDGDLDVLTCEERDNLGVIWYENPIKTNAKK